MCKYRLPIYRRYTYAIYAYICVYTAAAVGRIHLYTYIIMYTKFSVVNFEIHAVFGPRLICKCVVYLFIQSKGTAAAERTAAAAAAASLIKPKII